MSRVIVLVVIIALAIAGASVMKSWRDASSREGAVSVKGAERSIAMLPDGTTMLAKPGTVARDLVDWLASDEHSRAFELGGDEFRGRSAELTNEARGRVPRLFAMLKSSPDVSVHVVGHTDLSNDPAADQALSEARARAIVKSLNAGGISSARISYEGKGGEQPIADNRTAEGRARNQRVSIVLTRNQ